MAWVTDVHPTRAELSACVECGLCLPHCPTYRLTGLDTASPRGRLMAMSAVASGDLEVDATFADMMGFCLQCRACEAVCPSLVPFGRAMEGARAEVAAQRPETRRRMRHLLVGRLLPSRTLMRLVTRAIGFLQRLGLARAMPETLSGPLRGLRRLSPVPAHARIQGSGDLGTAALLMGCVTDPWFGGVQEASIDLLTRAGYRVVRPAAQTCCGALAAHDGAVAHARRLAEHNVSAFTGADVVVATAAGCSAHLREYGHWARQGGADLGERARDVTIVVAELINEGRLPALEQDLGPVAVQDPCHLRHVQRETAAPRTILTAAGYRPVDVDPSGMCCGAAGIYSITHPQASGQLGRRKASEVVATGSTLVASANPGCEMQLRRYLPEWYRLVHPVELYAEALRQADFPLQPSLR